MVVVDRSLSLSLTTMLLLLTIILVSVVPSAMAAAQHVDTAARALVPSPTLLWNYTTGGGVWSSPTLSPDGATLFVGSNDHNVYALKATDGSVVWQYQTRDQVRSSPTLSADGATLFVGSDDHNVYALKTGYQPPTYKCTDDQCVADPKGVSKADCEMVCAQLYQCVSNKCTLASAGLPQAKCEAACGHSLRGSKTNATALA